MSDEARRPTPGEPAPHDPWAPPEERGANGPAAAGTPSQAAPQPTSPEQVSLSKRDPWAPPEEQGAAGSGAGGPSVHDRTTVPSMPGAGSGSGPAGPGYGYPGAAPGEPVPPPPVAPDGPGQNPYGYPGAGAGPGYPGYPGGGMQPGYGGGYGGWGMPPGPSNGLGVTGLVLGIISAAIFIMWPIAIILGILAIIFGAIGRGKAQRGEATNPGQALAGIICGIVGLVLGVVLLVVVIATAANTVDDGPDFGRPSTVSLTQR
ncbi:DUF4190 domain-containing protein [Streptomyces sp. NPDC002851]